MTEARVPALEACTELACQDVGKSAFDKGGGRCFVVAAVAVVGKVKRPCGVQVYVFYLTRGELNL